ncbi:hypothetical protein THAOC_18666 [Thalassiosira oceanica]|uniref:Uncharacterized protein n=1 Tax=Thalassiosira oceanica TaxID=159749 RepID=K0SRF6_THAOC|nr:hypothetical protein THAOC_18666 [Thalassiosira oceanica]|eukprot:EJK60917.1 hypothetical protein THAOC_18666 [Thalassiosira oceanica]
MLLRYRRSSRRRRRDLSCRKTVSISEPLSAQQRPSRSPATLWLWPATPRRPQHTPGGEGETKRPEDHAPIGLRGILSGIFNVQSSPGMTNFDGRANWPILPACDRRRTQIHPATTLSQVDNIGDYKTFLRERGVEDWDARTRGALAQPDGERQVIRQNIIHLAEFDDEETDFPDVTAGEDERLVHYAISMPHSKTQPALPVPGLNGADGGQQHSNAEIGELNSIEPNSTTAIGETPYSMRHYSSTTSFVPRRRGDDNRKGNALGALDAVDAELSLLEIFPSHGKSSESIFTPSCILGGASALNNSLDTHPTQKSKEGKAYRNRIGTALRIFEERKPSGGQTPYARTFGKTPDISNSVWVWYDWIYYCDNESCPMPREVLDRVLGSAKNQGNEMAHSTSYSIAFNIETVRSDDLHAHAIDESILSRADTNGLDGLHFRLTVDREADAIRREQLALLKQSKFRLATRGRKVKILRSDGSHEWTHLADLKVTNPLMSSHMPSPEDGLGVEPQPDMQSSLAIPSPKTPDLEASSYAGSVPRISHIFGYRRKHFNADMVFDPVGWVVPATDFQKEDWAYSIYGCDGFCDKLPVDIPKPLGKQSADESDHEGYRVTRRFPIGFELHDSAINSVLETPNILLYVDKEVWRTDYINPQQRGRSIYQSTPVKRETLEIRIETSCLRGTETHMRGDLAGPQMKQSAGAASTSLGSILRAPKRYA